jgi:hypothetical protein
VTCSSPQPIGDKAPQSQEADRAGTAVQSEQQVPAEGGKSLGSTALSRG